MNLSEMNKEQLIGFKNETEALYNDFKAQGLCLNMSRGNPCKEQLELSMDMLSVFDDGDFMSENGIDVRNYGLLDGIPEAKKLFSDMIGVNEHEVIIFGNSSLNAMFWAVQTAFNKGILGEKPWSQCGKVKFLCPVPGYDRHFKVTEFFGIEMINIPMTADGPDMDMIEKLVAEDDSIKGIWCVPQYSNPDGISTAMKLLSVLLRSNPLQRISEYSGITLTASTTLPILRRLYLISLTRLKRQATRISFIFSVLHRKSLSPAQALLLWAQARKTLKS